MLGVVYVHMGSRDQLLDGMQCIYIQYMRGGTRRMRHARGSVRTCRDPDPSNPGNNPSSMYSALL